MTVELRILRYDPERDAKPHEESYRVEAGPMDRVLDLLHKVKYEQDRTLTFRRSCAHGVCGSDAMLINGRNRLACKIRVDQLGGKRITVAPLPGLPVMKDLVVDMEAFFAKFRSVQPFLVNEGVAPTRERRQSPRDRERFDDTTKCILCAACTSSCPSFWAQPAYVGAAARDPGRQGRRVALPHDLQLHGRLPARHPHHPGDPRGLPGDRRAARLNTPGDAPLPVIPHLVIRTDGAARGNPGPASLGAALIDGSRADALDPFAPPDATISQALGIQTNNVAEWTGVVEALKLAHRLGAERVDLFLDSKLIVEQLHGRWRVKDAKLIPLHAEARARLARFDRWSAKHVPRAQNKQADALCNEAIDRVQAGTGPPVVVKRPR